MTTTYHIARTYHTPNRNSDIGLLRIIDRTQVIVTTEFGAVHTDRNSAARVLSNIRRENANPFITDNGVRYSTVIVRKEVTA